MDKGGNIRLEVDVYYCIYLLVVEEGPIEVEIYGIQGLKSVQQVPYDVKQYKESDWRRII